MVRLTEVAADLDEATLRRSFHRDFSPIGWHWGHVAWQCERWVLRDFGRAPPLAPEFDALFDTFRSVKGTRGNALPKRERLRDYWEEVEGRVMELRIRHAGDPRLEALLQLAMNHEGQHVEIALGIRLLGELYFDAEQDADAGPANGPEANQWLPLQGGTFPLGVARQHDEAHAWDNEHEVHSVTVAPFSMQRFPVSEGEWLVWMQSGGYEDSSHWSKAGWSWRTRAGASHPLHWERGADGRWWRRTLSGPVVAGGARPVAHVSWYEAEAFARSQGARLPTEAEWEYAASWDPNAGSKRRFPWGAMFDGARADAGRHRGQPRARGACPQGASAVGVEDLCGGVWEWVVDPFRPYPGFRPGWYAEYSAPWFGEQHRVARGGSWLTSPANARTTCRNWYVPEMRVPSLGVRLVRDP